MTRLFIRSEKERIMYKAMTSAVHLTCEDVSLTNTDVQHIRPTFLSHFSRTPAADVGVTLIQQEHSYAKPWCLSAEVHSHAKPACLLFMSKHSRASTDLPAVDTSEIDIETVDDVCVLPYDKEKACTLMNECERNVNFARVAEVPDDTWEERINKDGWSASQMRLYNRVIKALHGDRLARLALCGHTNEPILRRLCVDKTAKRVRHILAAAMWDQSTMQWLHSTLVACLGQSMLAIYLDVLQVLRSKAPNLVEVLTSPSDGSNDKSGVEALRLLLKRPWDPVGSFMSLHCLSKLPGGASFIMVPDVLTDYSDATRVPAAVWRTKFWNSQLSGLGKVIHVTVGASTTMSQYVIATETAVRTRCKELRDRHPNRAVILVGWQAAGLIACRVSLVEPVTAILALGFPTQFISGRICGDADDLLLDCRTSTLFVVGQDATTCCIDDLEDMRERMQADTSLVVVGGADDRLRMSHSRRRTEGLTQRMVDRCVLDKIADFLSDVVQQHVSLDAAAQVKQLSPRKIKSVTGSGRLAVGRAYDSVGGIDAEELHHQSFKPHASDIKLVSEEPKRVVKRKKRSNITLNTKHTSPVSVEFASVAPSRAVLDQHASAAVRESLLTSLPLSNAMSCSAYSIQSCGVPLLKPTLAGFPVATAGSWMLASNASVLPASSQFHQLIASLSSITKQPEIINPMSSAAQYDGKKPS